MNFIINKTRNITLVKTSEWVIRNVFVSGLLLFSMSLNATELSTDLIEIDHKPIAPRFSLPDMQDTPRELTDYLGKPVIISFWATWCPPCRKEIPYFNSAWDKVKDDGIVMLLVNINEGKETIEAFEKKVAINPTILRDETAGQLANWNMTGLPTTFILDPEGRVVYQAMGERAWDSDEILDKVRALRIKPSEAESSHDKTDNDKAHKSQLIKNVKKG